MARDGHPQSIQSLIPSFKAMGSLVKGASQTIAAGFRR